MNHPSQGEVWLCDLEPTRGGEQKKRRPCVVISRNEMNRAPIALSIVVPLTTTDRGSPLHTRIEPPEGGLKKVSYATPEQVRSVSHERLTKRSGSLEPASLQQVVGALRILTRAAGD
jgi:mRNA interferase MazF